MKKERSVIFRCNFCELEQDFSISLYMEHLDIFHKEISRKEQSEAISKLSSAISKLQKIEKIETRKNILVNNNKNYKQWCFVNLKNKVLSIIKDTDISKEIIEKIKSTKTQSKLQMYINRISISDEVIRRKLLDAGIHINKYAKLGKEKPPKGTKPRKSIPAIKIIYTPMGNQMR